jgi:4-amino-4-deoxy-L-arabinose transferase-like glycosyltransferase
LSSEKLEKADMSLRKKIVIVLVIGFLFRLFIIFCLPVRTFEKTIQRYHDAAVNMLEGRGYSHFPDEPYQPSFYKPPVYSIFLAIIYKIFGVNPDAVRVVQAFLDTMGCLLLFYLLRHYFSKKLALSGLCLASLCPFTAVYINLLNPESLTIFFLILSLWLISKSILTERPCFFFAAGLCTILMGYNRVEFFNFVWIFGGVLLFTQIKKEKLLKKMLLYALGVSLIMTPWVARNYKLSGKIILLSAGRGLGINLLHGTFGDAANDEASLEKYFQENPEIRDKYYEWYRIVLYSRSSIEEKIKSDNVLLAMALERIRKNPAQFILMRIKRMPRVWINLHADEFAFLNTQRLRLLHPDWQKIKYYAREEPKEVLILGVKYLLFAINLFYVLLALRGLWATRRRFITFSFVVLPLLYAQAFFFFIAACANLTIPYWPCLIFFSAIGFYDTFLAKNEGERLRLLR